MRRFWQRIGRTACLGAVLTAGGGHWLLLQSIAWSGMLIMGVCGGMGLAAKAESATGAVTRLPDLLVIAEPLGATAPPPGAPLNVTTRGTADAERLWAQDSADLLRSAPGAAVVRNGPQTGMVQLRGHGGDRVRVSLDGRTLSPACPNHMDPPLHYAAPGMVAALQIMAGIPPVSQGGDNLGGTVLVQPPPPRFAADGPPRVSGHGTFTYRSANDGLAAEGTAGAAEAERAYRYAGSWGTADDLRTPAGRIRATGYDTQHHQLTAAAQSAQAVWVLDGNLTRTRDAGTPALPMDMISDDGMGIALKRHGLTDRGGFDLQAYHHRIDHRMDNFSLRPTLPGMPRMESPARSDDSGARLAGTRHHARHTWRAGADVHHNAFDAEQRNRDTGRGQDTFRDATRTRLGAHLEWQGADERTLIPLLGARTDLVAARAGAVRTEFPMNAPDAERFNAADREHTDVNLDAMAALRYAPDPHRTYELAVARQNRAPSLLERYLWTPLSASAGQADGRTYLGDPELKPETAHQIAFTAAYRAPRGHARISPFYQSVTDYIQGVPTERRDAQDRPVLRFTNLDRAEFFGLEGALLINLTEHWQAHAATSYVRARDRERDTDLYRIAPLRGDAGLAYRRGAWEAQARMEWAADQRRVSRANDEPTTQGYALLHLDAGYTWPNRTTLRLGIENLFDREYTDHLGGINRVADSAVAMGARLPGAGRAVVAALHYPF